MCEAAATFCYPSLDLPHQRLLHHWPAGKQQVFELSLSLHLQACTVSSVYFAVLGYSAAEVIRMLLLLSFCCFEQSDRLGKVPRRYTAIMAVVLSTAVYVLNYVYPTSVSPVSLREPARSTTCTACDAKRGAALLYMAVHAIISGALCFA
jgi:hypothetical protein